METVVDPQLKNLVANALESRGVLGKIKAELRAAVFLVLQEAQTDVKSQLPLESNSQFKSVAETVEGCLALELIREFLQYFELDNTLAVFVPEANLPPTPLLSHEEICNALLPTNKSPNSQNLINSNNTTPALLQLVNSTTHSTPTKQQHPPPALQPVRNRSDSKPSPIKTSDFRKNDDLRNGSHANGKIENRGDVNGYYNELDYYSPVSGSSLPKQMVNQDYQNKNNDYEIDELSEKLLSTKDIDNKIATVFGNDRKSTKLDMTKQNGHFKTDSKHNSKELDNDSEYLTSDRSYSEFEEESAKDMNHVEHVDIKR
ncbi:FGFR1 oncoprotein partner [Nowakowskiella sp. JEL0407]|nr:FGFR1 oncoprotein partner [Nowakowskiella sp. JEL0407]